MMERAVTAKRDDASISCRGSLRGTLSEVIRASGANEIRMDPAVLEKLSNKGLGTQSATAARHRVHNYEDVSVLWLGESTLRSARALVAM